MAKVSLKAGTTSYIAQVFIQDSSSTTGAGLTGLLFNTASLTAYFHRDTDTTATAMTLVTMTVGTFTSLGFKEIDATNMPGWYQLCPPNTALASGAKSCAIHLKGATNMAPLALEIELTAVDNQDAVRGGMTALPNAAAGANGGLPLGDASGRVDLGKILGTAAATPATAGVLDVNVKNMNNVAATSITTINANQGTTQPINFTGTAGSALAKSDMVDIAGAAVSTTAAQIGVNAVNIGGTAQTGRDIGASVLLSAGTGTGQLDFTSGVVKANLAQILGTALTETAGLLAGGFKKFFNVASPTLTCLGVDQTGDNYARLGAPAGASVSADVAAVKTDTGNLVTRITSTLFSGITSLAQWLGMLAGKQVGNTTARTEIRATGAGSGTFDETTDSAEAIKDNMGVAGAGLTALGDSRIANLDATVSSRVAAANITLTGGQVSVDSGSKTGLRLSATGVGDILTTALTESYAADGAAPTLSQAVFQIQQFLQERAISSTTMTVKRLDGSTTAMTFTLDSASSPTTITRAS